MIEILEAAASLAGFSAFAWLALRLWRARLAEKLLARERSMLAEAYERLSQAKAAAEARAMQFDATLAGMSDGLMVVDRELRLVLWNERFPDVTGVPASVLAPGLPLETMLRAQAAAGEFGPVDIEAEVARRMTLAQAHRDYGVTERTRPNGRTIELRRNALPDGGLVTLYTDVTARRRAEATAREAARARVAATEEKAHFVTTVSHELRTPLNALLDALSLLEAETLSVRQHSLATAARAAGQALLGLVGDVLELAQMEAGRLVLRPTSFAPRALLAEVVALFGPATAARGVSIIARTDAAVPQEVVADSARLRQVLINLVGNAAKFCNPGRIELRAHQTVGPAGPSLKLTVLDPGPPIPPTQAARLFRPFARLDAGRDKEGSGLGLAICERLVRLMGGGIGVSREGESNVFWFTVPLVAAPSKEPAGWPPPRPRRLRVLVVEDVAVARLVTATRLRRAGHHVVAVESAESGLRVLAGAPFDLVLTDLNLPGMDGAALAARMRAAGGTTAAVPVLALTAGVSPEDAAQARRAGVRAVLIKPLEPEALEQAMAAALAPPRVGLSLLGADFPPLAAAMGLETIAARAGETLARIKASLPALPAEASAASLADGMAAEAASLGFTALEMALRRHAIATRSGTRVPPAPPRLADVLTQTEAAVGEALRRRTA
ncbi:MAG: PAS-domain containing protein [Rhodospirillales bacterium]|nr:PAS-domain containing protein [Rhodospirillales bacterium]